MRKSYILYPFFSIVFMLFMINSNSQTFIYKLSENFNGNVPEAPPLVQIPNDDGVTGEFVSRTVPSTTNSSR
jgi:hypothetical protein